MLLLLLRTTSARAAAFTTGRTTARRTTTARLFSSTAASSSNDNNSRAFSAENAAPAAAAAAVVPDQSAVSQSRAPFRMPRQSPDDSRVVAGGDNRDLAWNQLGLWTELVDCLRDDLQLTAPTAVQQLVLPELLAPLEENQQHEAAGGGEKKSHNKHVAFLAATGSGKTLAYALPIMQRLKHEEVFSQQQSPSSSTTNQFRPPGRPRAVVLAPTRELALQIKAVFKQLAHHIKLSVQCVTGGERNNLERQRLARQPVDVLVATPGRLWKHVQDGTVVLSSSSSSKSAGSKSKKKYTLRVVVLDEMDTMLEQGFAADLQQLLYPVLYHQRPSGAAASIDPVKDLVPDAPAVWLTSATMTQAIQTMIGDSSGEKVSARKHYTKPQQQLEEEKAAKLNRPPTPQPKLPPIVLPPMKVLRAAGLHKTVPRLQQVFVDTANVDKLSLLTDVLSSGSHSKTMVFCNTASSCRAVEYALKEARLDCLSYHGDLHSKARSDNWEQFRMDDASDILVCTDLAARGLDVPAVDHVVMFDFPLNALDYLHRSGRTARGVAGGGVKAKVTALVSKRDKVLANAIERAVQRGEPLDGLSSRRTDYLPGGRLDGFLSKSSSSSNNNNKPRRNKSTPQQRRSSGGGASSSSSSGNNFKKKSKPKPRDTSSRKRSRSSR